MVEADSAKCQTNKNPGSRAISKVIATLSSHKFAVLLITALAIAVRFPLLGREYPMGFDDGVYAMSIEHVAQGYRPFKDVFSSQGQFFLELISLPARILPNDFWTFRLVPLIAGISIGLLVYFLSRKFVTPGWALFGGMLAASSGTIIRTTAPITSDGIVAAFSLLSVLIAWYFVRRPQVINAILLGTVIGFGCGIKSIFMIPTLIFLVVVTLKTPLKARLIAGATSVTVFAAGFFIFGFSDVTDQAVFYHLDKSDPLRLSKNISSITATFGDFDSALVGLLFAATSLLVFQLHPVRRTRALFKNFARVSPSTITVFLVLPTIALILIQAPLFRNHFAILSPYLILFTIFVLSKLPSCASWNFAKSAGLIIVVALVAFSISNLYADRGIKDSPSRAKVVSYLKQMPSNTIVLTNEPGVAWAAQMEVPVGFEDTSRYRYLSERESIGLDEKSFRSELANKNVCAIVSSPVHKKEEINLESVVPSSWSKEIDSRYVLWRNPTTDCS